MPRNNVNIFIVTLYLFLYRSRLVLATLNAVLLFFTVIFIVFYCHGIIIKVVLRILALIVDCPSILDVLAAGVMLLLSIHHDYLASKLHYDLVTFHTFLFHISKLFTLH